MDIQNPFRVSLGTAELYNKIGFWESNELEEYKNKLYDFDRSIYDTVLIDYHRSDEGKGMPNNIILGSSGEGK